MGSRRRQKRGRFFGRFAIALSVLLLASPAVAGPPSVYHSAADDGVDPSGSVEIPPGPWTVHLYLNGGVTASSVDPCKQGVGDGDEVCGWKLHLEGQSGLDLVSFTPTGDAVFGLNGNTLHATGGNPQTGTLGASKIGELSVQGVEGGTLELLSGDSISASQALETVTPASVVFVPEPGGTSMLLSGMALLRGLQKRRSRGPRRALLAFGATKALARLASGTAAADPLQHRH